LDTAVIDYGWSKSWLSRSTIESKQESYRKAMILNFSLCFSFSLRKGSSGEAGREVELEDLHEDEPPTS